MSGCTTYFVDLETTGLVPGEAAIIQLAAIRDVDGKIAGEMNIKIRPFPGALISPKALECNGISRDELFEDKERMEYADAYAEFLQFTGLAGFVRPVDRCWFAGYNSIRFDFPHMEAMAGRFNEKYFYAKFHFPGIDVAVLAAQYFRTTRHLFPDFKLGTVAKSLGVEPMGNLHDAMCDVHLTRDIYYKMMG